MTERPTFNGDNITLTLSIQTLLDLDERGIMTARLGGLARQLLQASAKRLIQSVKDAEQLKKLENFADFVFQAPVTSGVCCCGDGIKGHPDPMGCSHTPVDERDHALLGWAKDLGREPT